jgi:sugar phosphate isomerase/epimerase
MSTVTKRAAMIGIDTLVFGSAGARNVPEDFDRANAWDQIAEFAHMSADLANKFKLTIVFEPLCAAESNIANSVAEAMKWVEAVHHPNFKCLVDSYHFWLEDEPLKNLEEAMPSIAHVHVADKAGRVAPGESGKSDYAAFFRVLKRGGYDRRISVEAPPFQEAQFGRVLEFLKDQWSKA